MEPKKHGKITQLSLIKALAGFLAGVFLLNTICWGYYSELSPPLRSRAAWFQKRSRALTICRIIEKWGDPKHKEFLDLEEISGKLKNIRHIFKDTYLSEILPNEIIIEIPERGLAVRYFDPEKANVITPYNDVLKLETKVINDRLNRQIIHRIIPLKRAVSEYPPEKSRQQVEGITEKFAPRSEEPLPEATYRAFLEFVEMFDAALQRTSPKKTIDLADAVSRTLEIDPELDIPFSEKELRAMTPSMLEILNNALNAGLFIPAGKALRLFDTGYDLFPNQMYLFTIDNKTWETETYLGKSIWTANIVPADQSELGFAIGQFAFVDYNESINTIDNAYYNLTRQYSHAQPTNWLAARKIGVNELRTAFRDNFGRSHEKRHTKDNIFINLCFGNRFPFGVGKMLDKIQYILKPGSALRDRIYNAKDEYDRFYNAVFASEVSAELGSMIDLMETRIKEKDPDMAYSAFLLNVFGLWKGGTSQPYNKLAVYLLNKMLEVSEKEFSVHFDNLGDLSQFLESKDEHPAYPLFRLVKKAYSMDFWTDEERAELLAKGDAGISQKAMNFIDKNATVLKDTPEEIELIRVPVEILDFVDRDNIGNSLGIFQKGHDRYVELFYMSGVGEVASGLYQKYGLKKEPLPKDFKRTRLNTITLFPAVKGELISQSDIASRLGSFHIRPRDTVLIPIGIQDDPTSLIRGILLGSRMIKIAREIERSPGLLKDPDGYSKLKDMVQEEVLEVYKWVCDPNIDFYFTPEDIDDLIGLIAGDINSIVPALNKLITLLPITPIDPEDLRQMFEYVAKRFA